MFKKKIKTKQLEHSEVLLYKIKIEDMPTSVIQFAYEEFTKIYNEEIDPDIKSDLQMKLVLLSKILTDRSLGYGNGEVKHFFIKRGDITEEKWAKLSMQEKNNASNIMQSIIKMEKEVAKLANQDNTDHGIQVQVEDTLTPSFVQKEKKKSIGSFFKKKIPIEESKPEKKDTVKELLKGGTEPTKEMKIKNRAKQLEEATLSKFKFPSKKKDEEHSEPKIDFKSLENVYCHQCKHALKAHQSKGVSGGCRCGCLETIEDIAKEHGVLLYKPSEVLQKIEEENPINETLEVPQSVIITTEPEIQIEEVIENQAKKLQSMMKNTTPKTDQAQVETSSTTQKILEQIQPEQLIAPPAKHFEVSQRPHKVTADVCANCDHMSNLHFDNPENSFCTVIGCTCESFRSYPT